MITHHKRKRKTEKKGKTEKKKRGKSKNQKEKEKKNDKKKKKKEKQKKKKKKGSKKKTKRREKEEEKKKKVREKEKSPKRMKKNHRKEEEKSDTKGVAQLMNFHHCFSIPINSLWEAPEMKARSPEKFVDVSDVEVTDEDGFLSRSKMIKAKNTILKERIWIMRVVERDHVYSICIQTLNRYVERFIVEKCPMRYESIGRHLGYSDTASTKRQRT